MLRPFLAMSRFQLLSRVTCVSILLFLSGINTSAQIRAGDPKPINAVQGIVAAFKQHPVVIIGEAHWLRQPGEFYISLVHDREFQEAVQDIVVEFASRNNQPLLDKYIGGEGTGEGRGGEEGRFWGAADHLKKKKKSKEESAYRTDNI